MSDGVRERIIDAASALLAGGGPDAMTTRAVCAAAGVQAPTIYRFFGDKGGLLDAVTERVFASFVQRESWSARRDPVEDLRRGWDLHVRFGIENPAAYAAVHGQPRSAGGPSARRQAAELFAGPIRRIARTGRLLVPESRATRLVHAAATGATLELIGTAAPDRDPGLGDLVREAAIASIVGAGPDPERDAPPEVGAALTLRAGLDGLTELTAPERALLAQWLDRITAPG
ncbi:TetR/AcrR family transcriptional regulator [Saccharopolyspora sp. NFXS83]|uniref:TetR/AcrR family transcriptional regulator n=1 Tax=Saccharopolyspora sp. NFXS83 TaxID=2993560 RepID=UPI00224A5D09|nr:TetR/AcrR family transcriptional regulator [Saccharopolyspora sp. NFXS83]MCX2731463.1 TetR/AcrR family transcriptional regulator [Saccharopolyspora sp. NFXS83]